MIKRISKLNLRFGIEIQILDKNISILISWNQTIIASLHKITTSAIAINNKYYDDETIYKL